MECVVERRFSNDNNYIFMMPSNVTNHLQNVAVDNPNIGNSFLTSYPTTGSPSLMYLESERLRTYSGWPVTFLQPEAMAKAGFFYTKHDDVVRCPFCNVEVKRWEEGDNPWEDHRKWNPLCKFLVDGEESGNVPLPPDHPRIIRSPPNSPESSSGYDTGYDTCGSQEIPGMDTLRGKPELENGKSAIRKTKTPSFPQYDSITSRLESFVSWPVSLKIKPHALSEAGFYYTGKGDQTICFYCGGGLKDWEDTDDPWTEHARWFSQCTFVLLNKGEQFVQDAIESAKSVDSKTASEQESKPQMDSEASIKSVNSEVVNDENSLSANSTSSNSGNDAMLCKLCYNKGLEVVFLPCGHLISCIECSFKLSNCGVCRKPITGVVRTFLP